MNDTISMLGKLVPPEARRDAIHIAVIPCIASQMLAPGVGVKLNEDNKAYSCPREHAIGIVDPYLTESIYEGDRFWLFLKPASITSLRHAWTHPAFPEEGEQPAIEAGRIQTAISRAWMESWCQEKGAEIDGFLVALPTGEYRFSETDNLYDWDDFSTDFWKHYKVLTGKDRPNVEPNFRCAC